MYVLPPPGLYDVSISVSWVFCLYPASIAMLSLTLTIFFFCDALLTIKIVTMNVIKYVTVSMIDEYQVPVYNMSVDAFRK
jgi:hypothetical protein